MGTVKFWVSTAERAAKTFFQTWLALLLAAGPVDLWHAPWWASLSGAAMATAISIITSLASAPIGPDGSPSLVGEPPKVDDGPVRLDGQSVGRIKPDKSGPTYPYNPE